MFDKLNANNRKLKVLIVDDVHEVLTVGLQEAGHEVLYLPDTDRNGILGNMAGVEVLVIRTKTQVDKEVIEASTQLRCIARAGAGLDNIDVNLAEQLGITCVNAGEANSDAVGEHSLGMLLMLLNNLSRAHSEVKQGIWQREANRGTELKGKTIGIIGYGNTGSAFAQKLSGMGVKILAYDKYLSGFGSDRVEESNWEKIYQQADILSFHVPLTPETHHYLNHERLKLFKKPIWLLNLSRGKVVDTQAIVTGLKDGKLKGCALDVLENEKLETLKPEEKEQFGFLAGNPNVILTPHVGGWTFESYVKISEVLLGKLLTFSSKL